MAIEAYPLPTHKELMELESRRDAMSRYPFCPDHRDKVRGLSCRQCEIERLTKLVERTLPQVEGMGVSAEQIDELRADLVSLLTRAWKTAQLQHISPETWAESLTDCVLRRPLARPSTPEDSNPLTDEQIKDHYRYKHDMRPGEPTTFFGHYLDGWRECERKNAMLVALSGSGHPAPEKDKP
jgi:hypothetical protein